MLKNKIGNDRYMERGMNTFNEPPKIKSVQTSKITYSVSAFKINNLNYRKNALSILFTAI